MNDRSNSDSANHWIVSPLLDMPFVFGGSILAFVVFLVLWIGQTFGGIEPVHGSLIRGALDALSFIVFFFLVGAHTIAAIYLLMFNSRERDRVSRSEPNYLRTIGLIGLLVLVSYGSSFWLFAKGFGSRDFLVPVACIGAIYFVWTGWHFAMQQFGLLRLYKQKAGVAHPADKFFDKIFVFLLIFLLPSYLGVFFGKDRMETFVAYLPWILPNLSWLAVYQKLMFGTVIFLSFASVFWMTYFRQWKWPVVLCYFAVLLTVVSMIYNPRVFLVFALLAPHYIQEVYLVAVIHGRERGGFNLKKVRLILLSLFAFSVGNYLILNTDLYSSHRIGVLGGIASWQDLSAAEYAIVVLVATFLMATSLIHYYSDRLIYSNRSGQF